MSNETNKQNTFTIESMIRKCLVNLLLPTQNDAPQPTNLLYKSYLKTQ